MTWSKEKKEKEIEIQRRKISGRVYAGDKGKGGWTNGGRLEKSRTYENRRASVPAG